MCLLVFLLFKVHAFATYRPIPLNPDQTIERLAARVLEGVREQNKVYCRSGEVTLVRKPLDLEVRGPLDGLREGRFVRKLQIVLGQKTEPAYLDATRSRVRVTDETGREIDWRTPDFTHTTIVNLFEWDRSSLAFFTFLVSRLMREQVFASGHVIELKGSIFLRHAHRALPSPCEPYWLRAELLNRHHSLMRYDARGAAIFLPSNTWRRKHCGRALVSGT